MRIRFLSRRKVFWIREFVVIIIRVLFVGVSVV